MAFVQKSHCTRHLELPGCRGAECRTKTVVVMGTGCAKVSGRQTKKSAGRTASTAANMYENSTHIDQSVHIQNVIIVGDALGDLVRAGTATEADLICRTILENADLRRQVRTVENIPAAVFRVTKGRDGPQQLRNVKRHGRRVQELRAAGVEHCTTLDYCKATAVRMVDQLRAAVGSVDAAAPKAVREWAADVARELEQKKYGNLDYPTVLKLYSEASGRFYKLPKECRDAVSGGVADMAVFIADTAAF